MSSCPASWRSSVVWLTFGKAVGSNWGAGFSYISSIVAGVALADVAAVEQRLRRSGYWKMPSCLSGPEETIRNFV